MDDKTQILNDYNAADGQNHIQGGMPNGMPNQQYQQYQQYPQQGGMQNGMPNQQYQQYQQYPQQGGMQNGMSNQQYQQYQQYPQQGGMQNGMPNQQYQQYQQYPQQGMQGNMPTQKNKNSMKIVMIIAGVVIALLIVGVTAFLLGKGSDKKTDKDADKISTDSDASDAGSGDTSGDAADETSADTNTQMDIPVLGEALQPYMLWGQYTSVVGDKYFDVKNDDCKIFCDAAGMTTISMFAAGGGLEDVNCAAFPYRVEFGRPSDVDEILHFPDSKDGLQYISYPRQEELDEFRKNCMEQYGEEGTEYYQRYLDVLDTTFAQLSFCDEEGRIINRSCRVMVKVEGNKVLLVRYEFDPNEIKLIEGETLLSYDAHFDGRNLILREGLKEIKYIPYSFCDDIDYEYCGGYVKNDKLAYKNIIKIHYRRDKSDSEPSGFVECNDGTNPIDEKMVFNEDGTFTISWDEAWKPKGNNPWDSEKVPDHVTISGEYLWGSQDRGFVLKIDGNIYRYQYEYFEYQDSTLDVQGDAGSNMVELVQTQKSINEQLIAELNGVGIKANTDDKGRIVMDTNVLFAVDSDQISAEGQAELERFLEVYARVVVPYIEARAVSYVEVEGHTDTDGSYDYNLDLSQRRADAVASYSLDVQPELGRNMKAQGYSFSDPVLDASGKVDKAASRRVVFKIVLNS